MAEITVDFENAESITDDVRGQVLGYAKNNWRDLISEEHATNESLADIKTLDDAIKSYIHGQKLIGKDKVVLPGSDASEEELAAFFNKIGRPADPNEYDLGLPEGLPENLASVLDDAKDEFKKSAHKYGLTSKQAAALWKSGVEKNLEAYKSSTDAHNNRLQEGHNALKKEWGTAYDERMKLANKVITKFGDDGFRTWLKDTGLGKEPQLIKLAAAIGKGLSEDTISPDEKSSGALTPKEALSKANKIIGDKNHPYHNKKDPSHKQAIEDVGKLFEAAYPEEK